MNSLCRQAPTTGRTHRQPWLRPPLDSVAARLTAAFRAHSASRRTPQSKPQGPFWFFQDLDEVDWVRSKSPHPY